MKQRKSSHSVAADIQNPGGDASHYAGPCPAVYFLSIVYIVYFICVCVYACVSFASRTPN